MDGCMYPETAAPGYLKKLTSGQGIVGLVATDGHARYVPRLYFPVNSLRLGLLSKPFPHALRFEVHRVSSGFVDVRKQKVNVNAVKMPDAVPPFKSFVAVPVKAANEACLGWLCIDFAKTDPLARVDIKMASILGAIIADELQRIRSGGTGVPKPV